MQRILHSTKRYQIQVDQSIFGKSSPGSDVIHDANKLIRDINLKFRDIGTFSDIDTGSILTKHREFEIRLIRRYCPPPVQRYNDFNVALNYKLFINFFFYNRTYIYKN